MLIVHPRRRRKFCLLIIIYVLQIKGRGKIIRELRQEENFENQLSHETVCDVDIVKFLIEKVYSHIHITKCMVVLTVIVISTDRVRFDEREKANCDRFGIMY